MMDGWHMWGWGGWAMVIVWVVLLAALVYIVTRTARPQTHPGAGAAPESPLDVLKKRYARGEISKEEFEEKKKDLG
ncbi:MAG: SHOCT domain-containing protein [Chitinivibrionales bacterium]|nr:SHOCT domain-containing protein [Chitinivibrionales bacterium]